MTTTIQALGSDPDGAEWEVWYDSTATELNTSVAARRDEGWHPVSVDVYGDPDRYVVVWKKPKLELLHQLSQLLSGQPYWWNAKFGMTKDYLLSSFDETERASKRYPSIVTATKDPLAVVNSPALFSAVYTEMAEGYESLLFSAPITQLQQDVTWFRLTQRTLRWAAVYGNPSEMQSGTDYVGVYVKNQRPYEVYWNAMRLKGSSLDRYAHAFWRGGMRPSFMLLKDNPAGQFLAADLLGIWYSDSVGPHALRVMRRVPQPPAEGIASLLESAAKKGFFPYRLSAANFNSYDYFAVILAQRGHRLQRELNVRRLGVKIFKPTEPPSVPSALSDTAQALAQAVTAPSGSPATPEREPITPAEWALRVLDKLITDRMQEFNIRAGSLAVTYQGRLVLAHAYTFAEPGYPITLPTTAFRLGSIGKAITAIAIHQVLDYLANPVGFNVNLETSLLDPRFNLTKRNNDPPDNEHWGSVQIGHLLRHHVPWEGCSSNFCPIGPNELAISNSWGLSKPLHIQDHVHWAAGNDNVLLGLSGYPPWGYANFNFTLLGQVLERVTGQRYADRIKEKIWRQIGFTAQQIDDERRVDIMVLGNAQKGLPHGVLMPHHVRPEGGIPAVEETKFQDGRFEVTARDDNPFAGGPPGGWSAAPVDLLRLYATFDNPDYALARLGIPKLTQNALWGGWGHGLHHYPHPSGFWVGHNGGVPGGIGDSVRNPYTKVSIAYAFNIDPPETWWQWQGYQWKTALLDMGTLINKVEDVRMTGAWDTLDLWWLAGISEHIPYP